MTDFTENLTIERLSDLNIDGPDEDMYIKICSNWDAVAKPLDGMGSFEKLTARIGAILGDETIDISKKNVIIMCSDNGIVEEHISQSEQNVTLAVAKSMAENKSSVGRMAAVCGADTIPVDIGINSDEHIDGILNRKIRKGTRNFAVEPAMTAQETLRAIGIGIDLAGRCAASGYRLIATGEMGIGNTTTSSAVAAAMLKCSPREIAGRGAGLDDIGLGRKVQIIENAIDRYDLYNRNEFDILMTVGGLDIAGLAGVCIGGALWHIPVVLDGVISMTAALVAEKMVPGISWYTIPSHRGKEPAVGHLCSALGLSPVIDAGMALGEGTGAVMLFPLLDMALSIYRGRTTFADIQIEQYKRL